MALVLALVLSASGCEDTPAPRGQLVLYVDTDLPVPVLADTLRIEHLGADGAVREARQHVLPNAADWPVSVGVLPGAGGTPVRIRLRLFAAARSAILRPSFTPDAGRPESPLPLPAFVIDRVVEVTPPADRV